MDTVNTRKIVLVQISGDRLIGAQHELLNHALRRAALPKDDIHGIAVLHDNMRFVGVQFHNAAPHTALGQKAVQLSHLIQTVIPHQRRIFQCINTFFALFDEVVDLGIHTADRGTDHALNGAAGNDSALPIQSNQHRKRKAVDVFIQGACAV